MKFEHIWSNETTVCEGVWIDREVRFAAEPVSGRRDKDDFMGLKVEYAPFAEENASLGHREGYGIDPKLEAYLLPIVREALVARRTARLDAQDLQLVPKMRLRWIIDRLTDTRLTDAEKVSGAANHPFFNKHRATTSPSP